MRPIHADKPFVRLVQRRSARTGRGLGLPLGVAYRHPFPGLGLGVRTSGEKARGVASTSSLRRLGGSQFAFSLATIAVFQTTSCNMNKRSFSRVLLGAVAGAFLLPAANV